MEKAFRTNEDHGNLVVMLLPARTDTKWFHDYIYHKAEIRFIRGRLKFGDSKNSAPFPSMVVVYGHKGVTDHLMDSLIKLHLRDPHKRYFLTLKKDFQIYGAVWKKQIETMDIKNNKRIVELGVDLE